MVHAGYDPKEAPKVFALLKDSSPDRGSLETFFFGSHPRLQERIEVTQDLIRTKYAGAADSPSVVVNSDEFELRMRTVVRDNARMDIAAGRFPLAQKQLDRVLAITPKDPVTHLYYGDLYRLQAQRAKSTHRQGGAGPQGDGELPALGATSTRRPPSRIASWGSCTTSSACPTARARPSASTSPSSRTRPTPSASGNTWSSWTGRQRFPPTERRAGPAGRRRLLFRDRQGGRAINPSTRWLTIIAQDPRVEHKGRILRASVAVPYERLAPGPRGYRVHVIDYDASSDTLYRAAARGPRRPTDRYERSGDAVLVGDPGFHAQNVYAIAMKTLARFELALGRRVRGGSAAISSRSCPTPSSTPTRSTPNAIRRPCSSATSAGARRAPCSAASRTTSSRTRRRMPCVDGVRARPGRSRRSPGPGGVSRRVSRTWWRCCPCSRWSTVVGALLRGSEEAVGSAAASRSELTKRETLKKSSLFRLAEQMGDELQAVRVAARCDGRSGDASRRGSTCFDRRAYDEPHDRGELLVRGAHERLPRRARSTRLQAARPGLARQRGRSRPRGHRGRPPRRPTRC